MIESKSSTKFYCDGPNCEVEVTTNGGPHDPPVGWLSTYGPSEMLGEFHFHSGACYDKWRVNAENAAAKLGQPSGT